METETEANNKSFEEITKRVLILMPFRSSKEHGSKQSHLEKLRIRYIIENLIEIFWIKTSVKINYNVDIIFTGVGDVQKNVERKFEEADLFIALMSEQNVNVIYEIAVLNILQKDLILLLDESSKVLPFYFNDYARIPFYSEDEGGEDHAVKRKIDDFSRTKEFSLDCDLDSDSKYITEFKECIEKSDNRLKRALKNAIDDYEQGTVTPPQSFRRLVRDVHPSKALGTWNTYLPTSVLKVDWKPVNPSSGEYDGVESLISPPIVCSCNSGFTRLLGLAYKTPEEMLEEKGPLTGERQMNLLGEFISPENREWFERDQNRIFQALFIKDRPAKAIIPLEFNLNGENQHPYSSFRGKAYLPVLVGKKVLGVRSSQHTTYYIIVFVEDFFPFAKIPDDQKKLIESMNEKNVED